VQDRVYNSRIPEMLLRSSTLVCAMALLFSLPAAVASQWSAPQAELARKIAAATGPGAIAVDVVNRSSLSPLEVTEIRRGLLAELAGLGTLVVGEQQAAATVRVSLSDTLQAYVWVAEIRQGNDPESVVMVTSPRIAQAIGDRPADPMTMHKAFLWADQNRILDVAQPSPQHMIVLETDTILILGMQNGRWQQDQALPIPHSNPWPRDMRGRLVLRKDHLFDANLPGVLCRSTTTAPLAINCRQSDDTWPLASPPFVLNGFFARTRNFFTGVFSPKMQNQAATSPFYSAAALPRDKYTLWMFAGVDGQVHMLDGVTDQTPGKLGWGSDIATIQSVCGSGWQVLATSSTEGQADTIAAFEIADRDPVAVTRAVEVNGSVTALWTESDGGSAVVVTREAGTGRYEASRLSIACSQ
jgi:hypothetical protein